VRLGFVRHGDASAAENPQSGLLYTDRRQKYGGTQWGTNKKSALAYPGGSQAPMLSIEARPLQGRSGLVLDGT
jgi:hypothetical protein